jgi:uncharacterized protein (DUF4415 family)
MSKADPETLEWLKSQPEPDLTDPDNPEWTEEDFARARPAREVLGDAFVDAWEEQRLRRPGQRGPQKAATKRPVKLRLDPEVLDHFKAGGPGWQSRINAALRDAMKKSA